MYGTRVNRSKSKQAKAKARGLLIRSALCLLPLTCLSCSLKYDETISVEDTVPEFVFENVTFTRYQNAQKKMQLTADRLEQFKDNGSSYASQAEFSTWDQDGQQDTLGSCGLMGINTADQVYLLYDAINIKNIAQDIEIQAEALKWNGKTEQLSSGTTDFVYIYRSGTEMKGAGFSASGISRSFKFAAMVSGQTESQEETDEEN